MNQQETISHNTKSQCKSSIEKEKIELLMGKPMHRQFYRDLNRPAVNKEESMAVLVSKERLRVS